MKWAACAVSDAWIIFLIFSDASNHCYSLSLWILCLANGLVLIQRLFSGGEAKEISTLKRKMKISFVWCLLLLCADLCVSWTVLPSHSIKTAGLLCTDYLLTFSPCFVSIFYPGTTVIGWLGVMKTNYLVRIYQSQQHSLNKGQM